MMMPFLITGLDYCNSLFGGVNELLAWVHMV